jgi:hypothetical protein
VYINVPYKNSSKLELLSFTLIKLIQNNYLRFSFKYIIQERKLKLFRHSGTFVIQLKVEMFSLKCETA